MQSSLWSTAGFAMQNIVGASLSRSLNRSLRKYAMHSRRFQRGMRCYRRAIECCACARISCTPKPGVAGRTGRHQVVPSRVHLDPNPLSGAGTRASRLHWRQGRIGARRWRHHRRRESALPPHSVSDAILPGDQGRSGLLQKQKRAHHELRPRVRGSSPPMDNHGGCVQAGSYTRLPCGPVQRQHANSALGAKTSVEELKGGDAIAAMSCISVKNCESIPVDPAPCGGSAQRTDRHSVSVVWERATMAMQK